MMAIMLDPCFKILHIVESLVGCDNVIKLAFEYNDKIVNLLLMVCFEYLNPSTIIVVVVVDDVRLELQKNMFGVGALVDQLRILFMHSSLESCLCLRGCFSSSTCANPLTWWCMHESQFFNVNFLAKQILGIPSSQIEIEQVFTLVGVSTILRCYRLYVDNMDQIITIVKNWHYDLCANCKPNFDFKQYLKIEKLLAKNNYNLIEEHDFFEELQVDGEGTYATIGQSFILLHRIGVQFSHKFLFDSWNLVF
jgi:hypothetical protein